MLSIIVCNDFSLHMLNGNCSLSFEKISFKTFNDILNRCDYISCIGDKNIANVFGLEYNKGEIVLDEDTRLIVAKLIGGEYPPNDKKLIDSEFEFYDIKYDKRC